MTRNTAIVRRAIVRSSSFILRSRERLQSALILVLACTVVAAGCQKPGPKEVDPASAAPKPRELPALSVKEDTPNLLLTWIDEQGDFHVVQKPSEVPAASRADVRVVVADKVEGTTDLVYVANLNEANPDGTFRVKTITRAQWDELGAKRRKARLEALAPSATPPPAPSANAASKETRAHAGSVLAIVYGAEWCKPCHDAERYLRGRGVNVIKKDIEESDAAAQEMKQKLARAGMGGASIPVIDVGGRILIGFSPGALDRAVEAAQQAKTL